MEYAKITLLIPLSDEDHPRPDKWAWTELARHTSPISVVEAEFLSADDAEVEFPGMVMP